MTKIDREEAVDRIVTIDDEKKRALDLWDVRLVPPEVGIFDEPTRCYRINKEWAAIVMGLVSWLTELPIWANAENEGYGAIEEISRFLVGNNCMEFQLRQSPDDFCILQQTLDGGTTWSNVFDFSLCTSIRDGTSETSIFNNYITNLTSFQNNVYNNYVSNYTTSITDIHPELGYGDSDDAHRDSGLCHALTQLVDAICDSALEVLAESDNVANDLKSSLALVGAVLGLLILAGSGVGLPAASIMAASLAAGGIGLGAAVAASIYDKISETSEAALSDEAAKQELVCCLFDEMQGLNADKSALEAAFSACTGLSSNANDIRELGAIYVQEMAFYAAFAENLTIAFQSAKLDLLPECPCFGTWCYRWEFDVTTDSWSQNVGTHPYTESGQTGFGSNSATPRILEIQKDFSGEYVSNLTIHFFGAPPGSSNLKIYNDGTLLVESAFSDGNHFVPISQNIGVLKIRAQRGFSFGLGWIEAQGTGANPFGIDNCL